MSSDNALAMSVEKRLISSKRSTEIRQKVPSGLRKTSSNRGSHTIGRTDDRLKFERYWEYETVTAGLRSGQLLLGQLRINPKNYTEGYIKHPKGDADILLPGTKSRNRALNGDMVVIRLEPIRNWRVYDSFIPSKPDAAGGEAASAPNKHGSKDKNQMFTVGDLLHRHTGYFMELFRNVRGNLVDHLDDFTDPDNLPDEPSCEPSRVPRYPWWQLIQRTGRVVYIHRKLNRRACVGFLRPFVQKSDQPMTPVEKQPTSSTVASSWSYALLSPTDSRMPRIIIPRSDCPPDFVRQPETFELFRFVARIVDWPVNNVFAKGELIRRFGDVSMTCIDAETDRILVNLGFPMGLAEVNTFPDAVEENLQRCLAKLTREREGEIAWRRDFRDLCVFTIDPRTARDLDDALHIRKLNEIEIKSLESKGVCGAVYEVGVHIADVTYFVRPDSLIDAEAAARATSIYLVQLCVPMLPRQLCEDLCSLHPGADKLTFSVVFNLTADGEILTKWFGRTIIHSRAKLSYEDAQCFLDHPTRKWTGENFPTINATASVSEICDSVLLLNKLAEQMRARRFAGGSVQLNQVKPIFALDSDTGLPLGVSPFIQKQANRLVEEWMLAANEAVATLLTQRLPATAFLRRHPPPTVKQIKEAQTVLSVVGVDVRINSAGDLQESLTRISGNSSTTGWQHSDELAELCASMIADIKLSSDLPPMASAGREETIATVPPNLSNEARMLATLSVLTKTMNLAEYFCLGMVDESGEPYRSRSHYALNMDHYTHFTSPMRRYADVIVHRQLACILAENAEHASQKVIADAYRATCTSKCLEDASELAGIADYCNARKQDSRKASEESAELFFTLFVKECGPLQEACSVVAVLSHSFDVLILSTGLIKRVYLNKSDLKSFKFEAAGEDLKHISGTGTLYLEWNVRLHDSNRGEEITASPAAVTEARDDSNKGRLPNDPAICRSQSGKLRLPGGTVVGRDAAPMQSIAPPCACFSLRIKMFTFCRCQIFVEASGPEHVPLSDNLSTEGGSDQMPKLKPRFRNFDSYWNLNVVHKLLHEDKLIEGRLFYLTHNTAFIVHPADGQKILIFSKSINRALPNDIVAVRLNDIANWRVRATLDGPSSNTTCRSSPPTTEIIPSEAEEEFEDSVTEGDITATESPTSEAQHFQLDCSETHPSGLPTLKQVISKSPQLLSSLIPESNFSETIEQGGNASEEEILVADPAEANDGHLDTYPALRCLQQVLRHHRALTPLPSLHLIRTGRVVHLLRRDTASRRLIGSLSFQKELPLPSAFIEAEDTDEFLKPRSGLISKANGGTVPAPIVCYFIPERKNLPNVKLAPSSIPDDIWCDPSKANGIRYVCQVTDWLSSSMYPLGTLVDRVGDPTEIEPATEQILLTHGIRNEPFSKDMLKSLPDSEENFVIPHYEYIRRRDFRSKCVVSIDPATAKDIDDALHITKCAPGIFEVGVHIADVSFFVRPRTLLDREAGNRTTSVYLVQRVIPMLPSILSEHLCSLNPGVDRLTFSVVFKVNSDGDILDKWFGRSVIRSCAKLSYEDAASLIETPYDRLGSLESKIGVQSPFTLENIKRSVSYLSSLAQKMRSRRVTNGALFLDKVELQFDLVPKQDDTGSKTDLVGWPRGYQIKQRGVSHFLIEEWMLAANQAVAQLLFSETIAKYTACDSQSQSLSNSSPTEVGVEKNSQNGSPQVHSVDRGMRHQPRTTSLGTLLRRHPAPKDSKMAELVELTSKAAIAMDVSSAKSMRTSIDAYIHSLRARELSKAEIDCLTTALSYVTYMRMQMALYFSVEDLVERALRLARRRPHQSPSDSASLEGFREDTSSASLESSLMQFSHHFGLNVPLYTHFTSPIRRYADLMVHRQLAEILRTGHWSCPASPSSHAKGDATVDLKLQQSPAPPFSAQRLSVQAGWCNRVRQATRRVQEESQQLFLAAFIKSCGSITETAVVLGLSGGKVKLLIPACGLVLNSNPSKFTVGALKWCFMTEGTNTNTLEGDSQQPSAGKSSNLVVTWTQSDPQTGKRVKSVLSPFSTWPCRLLCSSRGLFVKAELLPPEVHSVREATLD